MGISQCLLPKVNTCYHYKIFLPSNELNSGLSGTVTGEASTSTGGANPTSRAMDINSFHSRAPEIHSPVYCE